MLRNFLLILLFTVNIYANFSVSTILYKNGSSIILNNNDIVFKDDEIKFHIKINKTEKLNISYRMNEDKKIFLKSINAQENKLVSFPDGDDYLVLDEEKGTLTVYIESESKVETIKLITNPTYTKLQVKKDDVFFKNDYSRDYIDYKKIISNSRGSKESNIIIPKLEKSVVIINVNGHIGTGVFIKNGNYILTNYHVIEPNEANVYIAVKPIIGDKPSKNSYYKSKVIKVNMVKDLALLEVPNSFKSSDVEYLNFGSEQEIKKGMDIYTMGHPHKYYFSFEYGMLNKIIHNHNWITYSVNNALQYSMNSNKGNSGGPIVSENLELIGIVAGTDKNGRNLNFAISIKDIKEFIASKESKRVIKKYPDDYKDKITEEGYYKEAKLAKVDRNGNGIPDAMMKDTNRDGVWDLIAYDTNEDGSYERITRF